MPITTPCQYCGALLQVDDVHAGREAQCPQCGGVYRVPTEQIEKPHADLPPSDTASEPALAETSAGTSRGMPQRWSLRTPEGPEYGPVDKATMDQWVQEGRVTHDCQLRNESTGWRGASEFYSKLKPERTGSGNPFAGAAVSVPAGTTSSAHVQPHRGGLILGLALAGLLTGCLIPSVFAWIMGNDDLNRMQRGYMDRSGYGLTQAGRILGMIVSLFWILGILFFLLAMIGLAHVAVV